MFVAPLLAGNRPAAQAKFVMLPDCPLCWFRRASDYSQYQPVTRQPGVEALRSAGLPLVSLRTWVMCSVLDHWVGVSCFSLFLRAIIYIALWLIYDSVNSRYVVII